jgi:cell wall assembly regulator SMI1
LERLERWLVRNRPRYLKGLRPGAACHEASFPHELKVLLGWHDGEGDGICGALEQSWHLMSAAQIVALRWQFEPDSLIPFLDDDAGNFLCLDAGWPGNPVCECRLGTTGHPIVAASLYDWLQEFVDAVERGEYCEDPERGTLIRKRSFV